MPAKADSSRIAIVEDEYIVALDIRNFLERTGYRVCGIFPSGDELLTRYEEIRPDLVLMDIRIKGSRDGIATASLLWERWDTPVIFLTAFADEETISRAKLTQPFGYIIKPFEERELRTAIEIALYRAAMEKRLRDSEERFRRLFEEGMSGNFLADAEGRLVEANPAFRRLLGLPQEGPLPRLEELFPDAASWQSFRTGIEASGSLRLAELTMRKPEGSELLVFANVTLLGGGKGVPSGMQGELSDLTEKRHLEERLSQTQRMEAVGRLAGGIAHDFNNILTAIVGYASLLEGENDLSDSVRDDLEGIRKAAGKASSLTRQLLAFSRQQAVSPRRLDTNEIIRDMEKMLGRILGESITFTLNLEPSAPPIYADPSQVEQVLVNLVVNAKDAMPDGGRLLVSTRRVKLEAPAIVGMDTLPAGDYALLTVRDSGTGIKPEIITRIFEPFLHDQGQGQGHGPGPRHGIWHSEAERRKRGGAVCAGWPAPSSRSGYPLRKLPGRRRSVRQGTVPRSPYGRRPSSSSTMTRRSARSRSGSLAGSGTASSRLPTRARPS